MVADALSRPPPAAAQPPPPSRRPSPTPAAEDWPEEGLAAPERPILAAIADAQPVDFSAMAAAQRSCPEVAKMTSSSHIADHNPGSRRHHATRGRLNRGVPPAGTAPTQGGGFPVAALYTPPGGAGDPPPHHSSVLLATDGKAITQMARACLQCQRGKVHRHIHLQPTEIPVPHRRFAHLHVDLVGPLPPSRGHTYLFTIIDRTSRWPEAIPLASITAADCDRALFAGWVSRFGVPATITSDRGAQFTSALWAGLCSLLNIQHSPKTAYHPQSNGLVERFHRRLKDALRSRAAAADWHDHLPWVLLGIRTAFREESEFSPAEAVYG